MGGGVLLHPNTRAAYAQAVTQFLRSCEGRGIHELDNIRPVVIAAYMEQHPGSPPTAKQHLPAIRMLFDWLVTGQVIPTNPASSFRGPKYMVKRGKTPVLKSGQARALVESIETDTVVGLRDCPYRAHDLHIRWRERWSGNARVAHTSFFMYAPREHAQHPCRRVLSVACPGFLAVADIKGDVGATREFLYESIQENKLPKQSARCALA